MLESIKHEGFTIEIHADEDAESPRDNDYNLGKVFCFHNRYNLGDKNDYDSSQFLSWDELKKAIEKDFSPVVILPVYMMDHSGLSISTDPTIFQACDPQRWDWGQIGFAFVSREDALREHNAKKLSPKIKEESERILQCEIDEWGKYISGEVYGYVVKDKDGEEALSYWGFIGYDYVVEEAKKSASYLSENMA